MNTIQEVMELGYIAPVRGAAESDVERLAVAELAEAAAEVASQAEVGNLGWTVGRAIDHVYSHRHLAGLAGHCGLFDMEFGRRLGCLRADKGVEYAQNWPGIFQGAVRCETPQKREDAVTRLHFKATRCAGLANDFASGQAPAAGMTREELAGYVGFWRKLAKATDSELAFDVRFQASLKAQPDKCVI